MYPDVTGLCDTCHRATMLFVYVVFKLVRHWALWKSDPANFLEWFGVWVGAEPYLSHGLLIWISLRVVLHNSFNEWHMGLLMRFLNVLFLI